MTEAGVELPESVEFVEVEGKEVYLVGTAHVSKESVEDVRMTVESVRPDGVAVELCEPRYKTLVEKEAWKKMNIFKIIREKKGVFFLAQLIMSAFYRKIGEKLGVQPGAEMLQGVESAKEVGAEVILADRKIEVTLKRVWGYLGFWNKLKMLVQLTASIMFQDEEISEELVEQIKQKDQLEAVLEQFGEKLPEIKRRLIDERDIYLAQKIRDAKGQKIVAVVGAGHVNGIKQYIHQDNDLSKLEELPPRSVWPVFFKWGIPAAIIGVIVYGFFKEGAAHSIENIYIWIMINGILSAVGAAAALAHPLTILSAFLAAPLTSINPFMAAGWVAGIVQAWISRPAVEDFHDLPQATSSVKGFWTNHVTKILLVTAFANIGSGIGTWIGLTWIATRTF